MLHDVIIIGGGISGLSCAYHMQQCKPNVSLKVLEAKDRLGGRLLGKQMKTVNGLESFDVGGQWIGRTQFHVMKLLSAFGLETYKQSCEGNDIIIEGHNSKLLIGNILSISSFKTLPMVYDFVRGLKKVDELSQMLSIEDPFSCPYAQEWDAMSLSTAMNLLFSSQLCRKMVHVSFLTILGAVDPNKLSFLYVLLYFRCGGGTAALVDDTFKGNAQEFKVKGGLFQLIEKLTQAIGIENLELNSPVTSVNTITDNNNCCEVTTSNGSVWRSKFVILAVPPHLISAISVTPEFPSCHQQFLQRLHPGHLIKFIASYEKRFWKENNLSGMSLHWPYYEEANDCPAHTTYDATSCTGSPAIVGFLCCSSDGNTTDEDMKKKILSSLELIFGEEAGRPLDILVQDWSKEPYNGGCPVTFSSPGTISLYKDVCIREPVGRLHFAGTESATIWRGFVDGAIQSGVRAGNEILQKINPSFEPTDVVTFDDILQTKPQHVFRNVYYAMNVGIFVSSLSCALLFGLGFYWGYKKSRLS